MGTLFHRTAIRPQSGGPYDQRLARVLVLPLAYVGLHPNAVTALSFVFAAASAVLFAFAMDGWAWLAAALFMAAVLADHGDGELARMTGRTSVLGHRLDYIVGTVNYAMLFVGLGVGLADSALGNWAIMLGVAVAVTNPIICSLRLMTDLRHGSDAVAHPSAGGFELEDFIYLIGPLVWFGGTMIFFLLYGVGTIGYLIFTIVTTVRHEKPLH